MYLIQGFKINTTSCLLTFFAPLSDKMRLSPLIFQQCGNMALKRFCLWPQTKGKENIKKTFFPSMHFSVGNSNQINDNGGAEGSTTTHIACIQPLTFQPYGYNHTYKVFIFCTLTVTTSAFIPTVPKRAYDIVIFPFQMIKLIKLARPDATLHHQQM